MTRYIEQYNETTDPVSGDYLWIVDASAPADDKDRKVDINKLAVLANRAGFTRGVGAYALKSSVAHNTATDIATLTLNNISPIAVSFLVAITAHSANTSSAQLYGLTCGYSTVAVAKLSEALFGHTSIVLSATINTTTRVITLSINQQNSSSQACSINISVTPLISPSDSLSLALAAA